MKIMILISLVWFLPSFGQPLPVKRSNDWSCANPKGKGVAGKSYFLSFSGEYPGCPEDLFNGFERKVEAALPKDVSVHDFGGSCDSETHQFQIDSIIEPWDDSTVSEFDRGLAILKSQSFGGSALSYQGVKRVITRDDLEALKWFDDGHGELLYGFEYGKSEFESYLLLCDQTQQERSVLESSDFKAPYDFLLNLIGSLEMEELVKMLPKASSIDLSHWMVFELLTGDSIDTRSAPLATRDCEKLPCSL